MHFTQLLVQLKNNQILLQDYVKKVCEKLEKVDQTIHSFLPEAHRKERLEEEAWELIARYPNPPTRPPLYGICVGIKDNLRVDGLPTKAGSNLPAKLFAGREATVVKRLKEAGALVLGKTVMTEFAYFEPGPTVNPHNIDHTPGGSSSGSAAAVAAKILPLTIGTQTMGSVNRPASFCGVVGFKPSFGRMPTDGLIHFSQSVDQLGFFLESTSGLDLVASIVCDHWQSKEKDSLSKPTLGIPKGPYLEQLPSESLARFDQYVSQLTEAGFVVKDLHILEDVTEINALHHDLTMVDLAEEHQAIYASHRTLLRPKTVEAIEEGQKVRSSRIEAAKRSTKSLRQRLQSTMTERGIDALICPSSLGPAPRGHESTGDPVMNVPWTHAGVPVVTLPVDRDDQNLPIGLQIVGHFGADETLVQWAKQLEQVFQFK